MLGWVIIVLAILQTLPLNGESFLIDGRIILVWSAGVITLAALIFEDRLNAFFARRRMLPGTDHAVSTFTEENYCSETAVGKTEWHYVNVACIAEVGDYFIFVFDQRHAQVYAKNGLSGGSAEEFRTFISRKTGKEVVKA